MHFSRNNLYYSTNVVTNIYILHPTKNQTGKESTAFQNMQQYSQWNLHTPEHVHQTTPTHESSTEYNFRYFQCCCFLFVVIVALFYYFIFLLLFFIATIAVPQMFQESKFHVVLINFF